jgi:hypothetical protein
MTKMAATRTNDITEVDTLDGATLREALGEGQPAEATMALATVGNTEVERVVTALSDSDWDGVEDGHLGNTVQPRLPRLLLNRKSGQAESGFTDELTGERFTDCSFVWLADTMTRAWWPEAFGKGNKAPDCRSRDGITPDPASPSVQAATCAACPNSQWQGDESPSCNASVEVMVYLVEQQRLSLVRFGGMAVSRVNRYLGALNAHIPRRPPIAYLTHVELEGVETPNGTFLVPKFSVAGEIPRAQATPLIDMRREKVMEWQEQLASEVAEGRTRDEGTAFGESTGPFDGPTDADAARAATPDDEGEF